jgi:hypothetical protein
MEHHRTEKIHRNHALEEMHRGARASADNEEGAEDAEEAVRKRGKQPLPDIVPTWACTERFWTQYSYGHDGRYHTFVLVVPADCRSWEDVEETGLGVVCFDQDVTPAMETICGIVRGRRTGKSIVERGGSRLRGFSMGLLFSLSVFLFAGRTRGLVMALRQLQVVCTTCGVGSYEYSMIIRTGGLCALVAQRMLPMSVSSICEYPSLQRWRLQVTDLFRDEHFFYEYAECVACRRASEHRRRSNRLAHKRKLQEMSQQ